MSAQTQIQSEIDLDLDGKQYGYLRVPYSVHRSAYGWLPVPIISIKNGAGPTVLLMAGNHGDEYEGQIGLAELARELEADNVSGQLIILPQANAPAAKAGTRTSPLDQGNLNRSFPGDPAGKPTKMIAHYIESALLSRADYLFDIHSGGTSLVYKPTLLVSDEGQASIPQSKLDLINAFGFPKALIYKENKAAGYSSSAATRNNAIAITAEMAGSGDVNPEALEVLRRGLKSALQHINVLKTANKSKSDTLQTQLLIAPSPDYLVFAREQGLFEPLVQIDQSITQGQVIANIHRSDTPWENSVEIKSPVDAIVVCKRALAQVQCGDCLYELAIPYTA